MAHYIELALEVVGALGTLSTALSHLPLPAKAAAFFARFGATTTKFLVVQKDKS